MRALIQAGGAGTRLKSITGDLPKPLVPLLGKPILQYQIESLARSGIKDITIVVGKHADAFHERLADGSSFGAHISYIEEKEPLGTGGALKLLGDEFRDDDFVFLFGDLILDIDWGRFVRFHKSKGALLTAFAHPNGHPYDSDLLVTDNDEKIVRIDSKHNVRDYYYENLVNAGVYVVSPSLLSDLPAVDKFDFEKDVMAPSLKSGRVFAYKSSEYVKDCGTPDRYEAVTHDLESGIVSKKNLSHKQKAVFLDRDGTINVFGDYVRKASDLSLMDDAGEAIGRINASEYLAICVTNQPVVARGEATLEELKNIHNKMEDLLGEQGAYLDDLFFCPHHPDKGHPGEVKELKIDCDCRKPKIGMLLKAKERYNIDLSESYMVGDTGRDVQTGINAGCKTILLTCGDPRPEVRFASAKPDYVCSSLSEAVDIILKRK